ncbi:hypothetical protein EDC56_1937 [Sinobacterium caligoides]|uniref:Uncharacterized protein n=1 Tax=Sinobacterium caligoides TaxID=933926 RepID=A0A3N2DQB1_9GAMM|nr:hypothetical protein [Sinobacterium caligoides]ROS01495.1 hypothetical protein EDC56_1937 [Sinobacterium caligoides]
MIYLLVAAMAALLSAMVTLLLVRRKVRLALSEASELMAQQQGKLEATEKMEAEYKQKVADLDYQLRSCQRDLAAQQQMNDQP